MFDLIAGIPLGSVQWINTFVRDVWSLLNIIVVSHTTTQSVFEIPDSPAFPLHIDDGF